MRLPIWCLASGVVLVLTGLAPRTAADVLELRPACPPGSAPYCHTALAPLLQELHIPTAGRSLPGPSNPVLVDISPGTFSLASTAWPYCSGLSHVTFRGAGRRATVLDGGGFPSQPGFWDFFGPYAVLIQNCSQVEFADLTIRTTPGVANSAIRFVGEGSTSWTHVWIVAQASLHSLSIAWLDSPSPTGAASHHYWNDAEIEVGGDLASGLWVTGSRHEIRSSEIEVESHATGGVGYGAIFGSGPFDVSVQGSTLTARDTAASLINVGVVYLSAASGLFPPCNAARLSIEGSRLVGSAESGDVIGINNQCFTTTGAVTARGVQFDLSGPVRRRLQGTPIDAPYALGSGANPPLVGATWSLKGQDTFVEIDCSAVLCNDTPQGSATHVLTFDPACATAGPWFDQTTQRCRGL